MKKLFTSLSIGTLLISSQCYGQSSVTLYGLIDDGINYISNANGPRLYNITSGILMGSRWGLRGREDLGNQLSAIFVLENGFDVNTGKLGQGGLEFGRQAYVGLSSEKLGAVTLGRQYDSVVDFVGPYEVGDQWAGTYGAHPADNDNVNNTLRTNNAVKFSSPTLLGGLTFGGVYSLGGTAGDFTKNQIWSLGARYATGPLSFGVAYLNVRNPNTSFYGGGGTVAATTGGVPGSNFGASPVISGYASAHTEQVIATGGSYTFGAATLGAVYSNVKFMGLGNRLSGPILIEGISGTATFNNAELNFKYQFTPALVAGIAYVYTHNSGANDTGSAAYHQGAIGLDYFLSKRTDVYALGEYQKAHGTDSTGKAAVASINQITPSNSDHQALVRIGLRHRF
jgi:predicted porin